jgi:hypothetical protein
VKAFALIVSFGLSSACWSSFASAENVADSKVVRIQPDDKHAGTAYADFDTYELAGSDCKTSFSVGTDKTEPTKKNIDVREDCKREPAERLRRYKLILDEVVKNHDPKLIRYVMTGSSSFTPELTEKMAVAAAGSKEWREHRARVNAGKESSRSNDFFVKLFNEHDLGHEFLETFASAGIKLKLEGVEKVFWGRAKDLAFAKKHPELAKTKMVVPYSAGVFEFKVIQ